jgi:hypothetical protein
VIDGDPTFPQEFFDITIAQLIAERPPHTTDNDLPSIVTPCEEWGLVHAWSAGI